METPPPLPQGPAVPFSAPPGRAAISEDDRYRRDFEALKHVLIGFSLMLATNVFLGWWIRYGTDDAGRYQSFAIRVGEAAATFADIGVVFFTLSQLRGNNDAAVPEVRLRPAGRVLLTAGLLVMLLASNYAYHFGLREIFGLHDRTRLHAYAGSLPFAALFVCVSPAIMEEFFFRRVCHDVFLRFTGPGAAAFASAVMFAGAHTGALITFPYFCFFGFCAARLRMKTGGLAAPMVLHFFHNLILVIHERFFVA